MTRNLSLIEASNSPNPHISARFFRAIVPVFVMALVMLSGVPASADTFDAPAIETFTEENAGGVEVTKDGVVATVSGVQEERVYVFVYPVSGESIDVGWQEPIEGEFALDLSLMPAGDLTIGLLGDDGQLHGWASTEIEEADSYAPTEEPAEDETGDEQQAPNAIWVWVAGVAGLAVLAVGAALIWQRRGRKDDAFDADTENGLPQADADSEAAAGLSETAEPIEAPRPVGINGEEGAAIESDREDTTEAKG